GEGTAPSAHQGFCPELLTESNKRKLTKPLRLLLGARSTFCQPLSLRAWQEHTLLRCTWP
ncbi:hypothetical protein, partial [Xanthomonas hortorum]|uniref:hypothetical protein n=1 Tax=Xanthomonas hortorum TaxID=56454 RepID=UPI0020443E2F